MIYYKDGAKRMRPVLTREEYLRLRNGGEQRQLVERIRNGEDGLKAKLVQMNYSCLPNEDGSLKGSKCLSTTVGMDIDHLTKEEMPVVRQRILSKKDELGLLMMEESARGGGYHLVFSRRPELSQEENLKWASDLLEVEFDKGAKDITRVFFTTTEAELIYLDDEIFEAVAELTTVDSAGARHSSSELGSALAVAELQCCSSNQTNTNLTNLTNREGITNTNLTDKTDKKDSCNSCNSCSEKNPSNPSNPCSVTYDPEARYNGVLFTDIIAKYWELFNGGKEPVEGDRNVLTFELAMTIRSICGYSLEKLMQVIPNYWKTHPQPLSAQRGEETHPQPLSAQRGETKSTQKEPSLLCTSEEEAEWRKTLENALKEPRKGMPYRLKQVLQALKSQQAVKACGGTLTTPPPMPKKLPPLIKLLTKNVPWFYKPAVANAVFPGLGAHLHGVKFRYWDNVEHEATFMNILIGRQSIGKGTIKKPIEYIMEDIRQRDQPNRQREADWKQKNPGAKQKKDPRPTDICIQMLIDNLTDAVFNQRIVDVNNNGERFIYTIVDEIEGLKKVTSKGTVDEVGLLIRKAFDNSDAGQERVGADSVSGIAPLRWNFNASTTPPNARKFFYKMVNDGTVSRLDISTIIRSDDDDDDTAPVLGIYDHTFAEELKPYIDRLDAANGLIECAQAKKLSLDMKQENKDAAKLYESEAYRVFSYRANVIAWLKGMVLYVAHGYKWSKEIADFVRWTEQYNLWCKMLYFGQQLEKELREEVEIQRQSGPQNLLELLPDEFTTSQYRQMRQQQGKSGDGDSTLRSWQSRGHIVYDEVSGRYCKTEQYKLKFSNN